jgi:hypothetical protein
LCPTSRGRAFANGAAPVMFQVLLGALAAFAAGAFIQRILLGEYGITVGPISVPELTPVEEPAAAKAVDLITESPEISAILDTYISGFRGPQPSPQFTYVEDSRLALLSIRTELEQRLRELALAVGIDRDIALSRLPTRLMFAGTIDEKVASGLRQLIEIGDRIAAGAQVEPDAEAKLRDQASYVLYALGELRRRVSQQREG